MLRKSYGLLKIFPSMLIVIFYSTLSWAIPVGTLSYESVNPGVNRFNIINYSGVYSLPPDFPINSDVILVNTILDITKLDNSILSLSLGDIDPGEFPDLSGSLMFPDTELFIEARIYSIYDPSFSANLTPFPGGYLSPGDSAMIEISVINSSVPEPSSFLLLASGILILIGFGHLRRNKELKYVFIHSKKGIRNKLTR